MAYIIKVGPVYLYKVHSIFNIIIAFLIHIRSLKSLFICGYTAIVLSLPIILKYKTQNNLGIKQKSQEKNNITMEFFFDI